MLRQRALDATLQAASNSDVQQKVIARLGLPERARYKASKPAPVVASEVAVPEHNDPPQEALSVVAASDEDRRAAIALHCKEQMSEIEERLADTRAIPRVGQLAVVSQLSWSLLQASVRLLEVELTYFEKELRLAENRPPPVAAAATVALTTQSAPSAATFSRPEPDPLRLEPAETVRTHVKLLGQWMSLGLQVPVEQLTYSRSADGNYPISCRAAAWAGRARPSSSLSAALLAKHDAHYTEQR